MTVYPAAMHPVEHGLSQQPCEADHVPTFDTGGVRHDDRSHHTCQRADGVCPERKGKTRKRGSK